MKFSGIIFVELLALVSCLPRQSESVQVKFVQAAISNVQSQLGLSRRSTFDGTVASWITGDGHCTGSPGGTVSNPVGCWGVASTNGNFDQITAFQMNPSAPNPQWTLVTYSDSDCNNVVDSRLSREGQICMAPSPGVFTWSIVADN
jgi:hypothetical protein